MYCCTPNCYQYFMDVTFLCSIFTNHMISNFHYQQNYTPTDIPNHPDTHLSVDVVADGSYVRLSAVIVQLKHAWPPHLDAHLWTHLVHRLDEVLCLGCVSLREDHHPTAKVHLKTISHTSHNIRNSLFNKTCNIH